MWSGAIASIPTGWVLCDGSNGTPNLTDRFVIAADASGSYPVGSIGDGSLPATTVTITAPSVGTTGTAGININTGSSNYSSTITGSFGSGTTVVAVYYALAYIMKT